MFLDKYKEVLDADESELKSDFYITLSKYLSKLSDEPLDNTEEAVTKFFIDKSINKNYPKQLCIMKKYKTFGGIENAINEIYDSLVN